MKKTQTRIVIYPKDVECITGRRLRTCRKLLQKIRKGCGKNKDEFVTITEFAAFTGIEEEHIREFLST
jgi:hypothetical protein